LIMPYKLGRTAMRAVQQEVQQDVQRRLAGRVR
jgi:hypothetical protein